MVRETKLAINCQCECFGLHLHATYVYAGHVIHKTLFYANTLSADNSLKEQSNRCSYSIVGPEACEGWWLADETYIG